MKLEFMLHGIHPNYTPRKRNQYPWIWTYYHRAKVLPELSWIVFQNEECSDDQQPWKNYILKKL